MAPKRLEDTISKESLWRRIRELEGQVAALRAGQLEVPGLGADIIPELEAICKRRHGYWRFGLTQGGQFWTRFKWTTGPLQGRYAIGGHEQLVPALWTCVSDYDRSEAGKKLPPLDAPPRKIGK